MNKFLIFGAAALALLITVLILSTCSNPLTAGLGEKVDLEPPTLKILSHTNGQYVLGLQSIGGTWNDDGELESIQLSFDDGTSYVKASIDSESGNWFYDIETGSYPDGEKNIIIIATDSSGKIVEKKLLLYFDNRVPVVLITEPQAYASQDFNEDIIIRGEATDSSGIVEVQIEILDASDVQVTTPAVIDGTNSWSFLFLSNTAPYDTETGFHFNVTATDKSGQKNTYIYHYDDILSINGSGSTTIEDLYSFEYGGSPASITFSTADLSGIRLDNLPLTIDQTLDSPQFDFSSPSETNFSLGANAIAVGSIYDDDGVDITSVEIRIDSTSDLDWISIPLADINGSGYSISWEYDLSPLLEGTHTMDIRAMDIYGESGSATLATGFVIDTGVPDLQITSPAAGEFLSSDIIISGTTSDGVGVATVEVSIDNSAFIAVSSFDNLVFTESGGLKTYNWSHLYPVTGLNEGSHLFRIKATDVGEKIYENNIQLFVDSFLPTVKFLNPANGNTVNGTINVQGTSTDSSPITTIQITATDGTTTNSYIIDDVTNEFDLDEYGTPSTYYGWYKNIDTTVYTDLGQTLTITIDATDSAGNIRSQILTLNIDQTTDLPELIFDNIDIAGTAADNAFSGTPSLIGRVIDDDGVAPATVEINLNGAGWIPVTAVTGSGLSVSWSHDLAGLPEGTHTVEIRADDINGGQLNTSATGNFLMDLGAPQIALSKIVKQDLSEITSNLQGSYINQNFAIQGTSTDGYEVASTTISINGGVNNTITSVVTDTSGGNWVDTWFYDIDVSAMGDGNITLSLTSTDISGKISFTDLQLLLDTVPPSVEYILPLADATVNGTITVKGTTGDANKVDAIEIYVLKDDLTKELYAEITDAVNTFDPGSTVYSWEATADTTAYDQAPYIIGGRTILEVVAYDGAGNASAPANLPLIMDQTSDKPDITPNSITLAGPNALGADPAIIFTVEDDDGVDVDMIQSSLDSGTTWNNLNPVLATSDTVLIMAKTTLTGIAQGIHTIRFRAMDINAGANWIIYGDGTNYQWFETTDYPLSIDYGPPSITITSPIASSVFKDNFNVTGTSVDFLGVSSIELEMQGSTYTKNYVSEVDFPFTPTLNDLTDATFDFPIPIDTDPGYIDGDYNLQIRATDGSGTIGTLNIPVGIDQTAPTAVFSQPAAASTINGTITVRGEVDDNRQVTNTYLWHGLVAATPPALTDPSWTTLGSSLVWSYSLDTSPVAPTAAYKVVVITEDVSGNRSAYQTLNLTVDQTTDRPGIELTNLIEGASDNALGRNARITGNVNDDDGIGPTGVQIRIDPDSGAVGYPDDENGWVDVTDPPVNTGTLVSWFHDISLLSQGPHTTQVRTRDINTADNTIYTDSNNYGWTRGPVVDFYIDYGPPTLTIDDPVNGSVENTDFTISGTATDANSVTNVEISFDGGIWNTVTTSDSYANWSYTYTVPAAGTVEQVVAYQVRATDNSLAETTQDRQVVIDVKAPTVTGISQPGAFQTVNGTIDISGQATDGYNLTSVYYYVGPRYISGSVESPVFDPAAPSANWTLLSGSYAWSAIDLAGIDTTSFADGDYTLYVVGVDSGLNYTEPNNISDSTPRRNFTINQVSDRPVISLNTISTIETAANNLLPPSLQISGTIGDDDAVENSSVQIRIDSNDGDFADGGLEDWANISGQPMLDANLVTWSHTFIGFTDGQYSFQMRAADSSYTGDYGTTGIYSWDSLRRSDDSTVATVPFSVDLNNPTGSITFPGQGTYHNADFTIDGIASDASGIKSVEIKFGTDAPIALTPTDIDGINYTWSHTYSITGDGQVQYQLIVTDNYDKIFTTDRYFTIDTTGPTIGFFQPSDGYTANGSLLVRGDANDTRLVDKVYIHTGADGAAASGDPVNGDWTGWEPATGTFIWSHEINTSLFSDGLYDVHARAVDGAGNVSGDNILNVNFDQTSDRPSLSFLNVDEGNTAGENLLESNAKILGTAEDDDGLSKIQFAVASVPGTLPTDYNTPAEWSEITTDGTTLVAVDGRNMSWSNYVGNLTEGVHYIKFRVEDTLYTGPADVFNENYSADIAFTVDLSKPTVDFTEIEIDDPYTGNTTLKTTGLEGIYINDSFDVRVNAGDTNGISTVVFSTNSSTVAMGSTSDLGSGNWECSFLIDRDGSDEGSMTIFVEVTDTVGKVTTNSLDIFIDTTEPTAAWDPNSDSEIEYNAGIPTFFGNTGQTNSLKLVGESNDENSIERIDIFFDDGTNFYSPRVLDIESIGGLQAPSDSSYIITVNNRLEKGTTDSSALGNGDDDGFLEYFVYNSGTLEWYVYLNDTYLFPEGPITIHTWSYDEAGNRNVGVNDTVSAQISNYPPSIDSYDINSTNYDLSQIKTKADNLINLTMYVSDSGSGGINTATFKMTIAERYELGIGGQIGEKLADIGTVLTNFTSVGSSSADISIDTSGLLNGFWYRIEGEIRDDDGNIATREWWLWEFDSSTDTQSPIISMDIFSQSNVDGSGHIEEAANSPDLDSQADLSGTITVSGDVWDDNPNPTVIVQYYNGSTWVPVSPGTLDLINIDDGDDVNGIDYTWTVVWDTSTFTSATLGDVAAEDIQIRAVASDGNSTDSTTSTKIVDIVPYITDITTGFEIGLKAFIKRSALGKYTVASGSAITINGYNLSDSINIGGTTPVSSGDTTQQVLTLGSTNYGALTVTTNGVPGRNNTNTNTLPQNGEASQYYPDRNDDRYIALWDLTDTGFSGDDATMRPVRDTSGLQTGMEWMYVTTSDTLYLSGTKMTSSFTLSGGDFGYNDSGTRLWAFLHNAKWWITNESATWNARDEQFYGSIQWSMENGYTYTAERDEAYNWNIDAQTGRLGLGNMVYQAETLGQIDRYENLQMKLYGNDSTTTNLVAYYDKNTTEKGITFVSFNTGTTVPNTDYDLGNGWYSTIERVNPYDKAYAPTGNEGQKATGTKNPEYAGTATIARHNIVPGNDAGSDFILLVDSTGIAYIVWYDPDSSTGAGNGFDGAGIKFMFNLDPVGTPTIWTDPETVISNGSNTAYSHIAMVIAPDGSIHIAYQDNNSGYLNYTYAASRTDVGTTMNTVLVDALFSSGQYNSIVIKDFDTTAGIDYRPVITTFSSAYTGTNQSLRLVYPNGEPSGIGDGANINGNFTGNWESIAIPAATAPQSVKTFTETSGTLSGEGNLLIGYNGLYMEQARYLDLP